MKKHIQRLTFLWIASLFATSSYGQLTITTDITPSCNNGNAVVSFDVSNGQSPYFYTLYDSTRHISYPTQSSYYYYSIDTGLYVISVTDNSGGNRTSAVFSVGLGISLTTSSQNELCGQPTGAIWTNADNGNGHFSYRWSTGDTTPSISGLYAGTYRVVATNDNGCYSDTVTTRIYSTTDLRAYFPYAIGNGNCTAIGTELAVSNISSTAWVSYRWSTGDTTGTILLTSPGTYYVTVTDSMGCIYTDSIVTGPFQVVLSPDTLFNVLNCLPISLDPTILISDGNYSYAWSRGNVSLSYGGGPNTAALPGTYTVTVTDSYGCTATQNFHILDFLNAITGEFMTGMPTCGHSNGSILLSSPQTGSVWPSTYHYVWSNDTADHSVADTLLPAGVYSCTITDDRGCSGVVAIPLNNADINFSASITHTPVVCPDSVTGATVHVSGTGPYSYLWSTGDTGTVVMGIRVPSILSVTVTDPGGCYAVAVDSINSISPVNLTIIYSPCTDTLIALATGGTLPYSYGIICQTCYYYPLLCISNTIFAGHDSTYGVQAIDANGCKAIVQYTTSDGPDLQLVDPQGDFSPYIGTPTCFANNGYINIGVLNGTAPYSYNWSTGDTTAGIYNLGEGSYSVTVTDAKHCTAEQTDDLQSIYSGLWVYLDSISELDCLSSTGAASVSVSGGTPPYIYTWSNYAGDTVLPITGNVATNLNVGEEYLVYVIDSNHCEGEYAVSLNGNPLEVGFHPITTISADNCDQTTATISPLIYNSRTNEYCTNAFYAWSNGDTGNVINVTPGRYAVTVTDPATGCSVEAIENVAPWYSLYITTASEQEPGCGSDSGSISVTVSGGSGLYNYWWSNRDTGSSITGLPPGSYGVTVRDFYSGCEAYKEYALVPTSGYAVSVVAQSAACDTSLHSGSATAYISSPGGTPPYSFMWYDSASWPFFPLASGQAISGLYSGESLIVSVTDSLGCAPQYYTPPVSYVPNDYICYGYITGYVFYDTNGNCLRDAGEPGMYNAVVSADGTLGHYYYANPDTTGFYEIQIGAPDIYTVNVNYQVGGNCISTSCDTFYVDTFSSVNGQLITGQNFATVATSGFDLMVQGGCAPAVPGGQRQYWLYTSNDGGSTAYNAVLTYTYDSTLTLQACLPPYSTIDTVNHIITWLLDSVPVLSSLNGEFDLMFTVAGTDTLSQLLYGLAQIQPIAGDCNPSNNTFNETSPVNDSHDPNEKIVYPSGYLTGSDTILTYIIRFQNTGNAPANTVVISDTLSPNVNPTTVLPGASSAPYKFSISGTGILTFTFLGINLPDSSHGASSMGFVQYTVHTQPGLDSGAQIANTAYIYFDLNPAVITNTTLSATDTPVITLGIKQVAASGRILLYPNPNHGSFTLQTSGRIGSTYTVSDMLGNVLVQQTIRADKQTINLPEAIEGVYTLSLRGAESLRFTVLK